MKHDSASATTNLPAGPPAPGEYAVPAEVCDAIRAADKIALIGHVTPDADCIGVIGGMTLALHELGKHTFPALPEGTVSRKLRFLVEMAGLRPATTEELAACDLAVVMDTAKDRRVNVTGKLEALPRAKVLNVDHHASNTLFGTWNWVDGHRSSTCEMVYEILRALGCQVTPTIATLIYAGIHSDTQGFSLPNTTARSLQVGHELAAAGARICEVGERLHRSRSRGEIELLKAVYGNLRISADGRLAWSAISHEEMTRAGAVANDIDDQVEICRSVEGIYVAILFSEGDPGRIRMNFRGEQGVSILPLAQQFGGGGHNAAAGAIHDGTIAEVAARVVPVAEAFVANLPACETGN